MTPRFLFSVGLRILGVWEMLVAKDHLVTAFSVRAGAFQPAYTHPSVYLLHSLVDFVIAMILLNGAPYMAAYCYRDSLSTSTASEYEDRDS